jgi:hypothetical protein
MTVKKTLGAYADCAAVLEAALREGEISVPFASYRDAVSFRHRCYRLRKRLIEVSRPAPGQLPASRYDSLILLVPNKGEEDDHILTVRDRGLDADEIVSRIRTRDGKPVVLEESDFEDAVAEFKTKLNLE